MMMDQLAFSHMLSEAHERHLDELRTEVQQFFDGLSRPSRLLNFAVADSVERI